MKSNTTNNKKVKDIKPRGCTSDVYPIKICTTIGCLYCAKYI